MTTLFNDPASFSEDQLAAFAELYSDRLRAVAGGVVAHRTQDAVVAVVIGGGSGHYPAFAGLVGPGFASGAVVGNIFTSPSAAQIYSVAKAANQGRGVVLSFGNYAGDVMNFGIAAEQLRREGIDTRIVLVTDDVASSPEEDQRRGIAGDFTVFKVMGAAAAAGFDLDEVERVGRSANASTRSFGIAFSGCTMPGATEPLFTVPDGHMGVGLGIHGEPGIHDAPLTTARDLAAVLVDGVLAATPSTRQVSSPEHAAAILNGLGTTKYEELFLLWGEIAPLLREAGIQLIQPEVGELVTSLDMGGTSLTLMWLDDELETFWNAPAYTPAYRKDNTAIEALLPADIGASDEDLEGAPEPSPEGSALGPFIIRGLRAIAETIEANEAELGRIDAVAGDGDHGRGMRRGADAALAAVTDADGGPAWLLRRAGRAWAAEAGGTSGVLWGAGLEAAGTALTDTRNHYAPAQAVAAADAFAAALLDLGGAEIGDKTIIDALLPFVEALRHGVSRGNSLHDAWTNAAFAAAKAAESTAVLSPKRGRARPLAEKSIGTPDAGATSFSLIVDALAELMLAQGTERTSL